MSRLAWGVGLLVSVLVVLSLNLRGSRPELQRTLYHEDSKLQEELLELRHRVKALEHRLSERGIQPARPLVATAKEETILAQPASSAKPAPQPSPDEAAVTPGSTVAHLPLENAMVASEPEVKERKAVGLPTGTVGMASYWTDIEVFTPAGWCRKPPPYAAAKPELLKVPAGTDKPTLTAEFAKKHASEDNMLIATYVNYNRLDFAYTFVKHLRALNNPHFIVGALDEKALRGLQHFSVPAFLIDSGLTTNDYGWGTHAFRQLGLHKVQLVLNLAKTGVDCLTVRVARHLAH